MSFCLLLNDSFGDDGPRSSSQKVVHSSSKNNSSPFSILPGLMPQYDT
jgi:hypothetical protein